MIGRVFMDWKGIARRKEEDDTIHELEWEKVSPDAAEPVSIEYLSNCVHSCKVFVMKLLRYRLIDGPNHSLFPPVTHRGVFSDGLLLDSVRLNEIINGGGGEAERVIRLNIPWRSEGLWNILLHEAHNDTSGRSTCRAYNWPGSDVLHRNGKVTLMAGTKGKRGQ